LATRANMPSSSTSQEIKAIRINTGRSRNRIVWQSRYEGCVAVAYVNGRAVAGISGPWSDKYALTCWERPAPGGQLELFDSLDAAKRAVEQRAQLTGTSRLITLIETLRRNSAMVARALLPHRKNQDRPRHRSPQDTVMQLRLWRQREDTDLSGMYFHAFD
jgi:hypothetical protein